MRIFNAFYMFFLFSFFLSPGLCAQTSAEEATYCCNATCCCCSRIHRCFEQLVRRSGSLRIVCQSGDITNQLRDGNIFFERFAQRFFMFSPMVSLSLRDVNTFLCSNDGCMLESSSSAYIKQYCCFICYVYSKLFNVLEGVQRNKHVRSFLYDIAFFYIQFSTLPLDDLFNIMDKMYQKLLEYLSHYQINSFSGFASWLKKRWWLIPISGIALASAYWQWKTHKKLKRSVLNRA